MCSGRSDWALPQPGFPIRRSTDQSLVDSSPWLFAATHVLHRHLAPRHPPLALCSLKSHTPRTFRDREIGTRRRYTHQEADSWWFISRRSCSLCSSQEARRDESTTSRGGGTSQGRSTRELDGRALARSAFFEGESDT